MFSYQYTFSSALNHNVFLIQNAIYRNRLHHSSMFHLRKPFPPFYGQNLHLKILSVMMAID
ncbi:hypothetical protein L9F63_013229, partial [Diploptera punctata]